MFVHLITGKGSGHVIHNEQLIGAASRCRFQSRGQGGRGASDLVLGRRLRRRREVVKEVPSDDGAPSCRALGKAEPCSEIVASLTSAAPLRVMAPRVGPPQITPSPAPRKKNRRKARKANRLRRGVLSVWLLH